MVKEFIIRLSRLPPFCLFKPQHGKMAVLWYGLAICALLLEGLIYIHDSDAGRRNWACYNIFGNLTKYCAQGGIGNFSDIPDLECSYEYVAGSGHFWNFTGTNVTELCGLNNPIGYVWRGDWRENLSVLENSSLPPSPAGFQKV